MMLIADSGSTKTNWSIIGEDGIPRFFDTEGYNPYFQNSKAIASSLSGSLPADLDRRAVGGIHFYGAGCFEDKADIVAAALRELFPAAKIFVGLDLFGSARALLGNGPGFIAILGTGANTGLYDGTRITANIDSLGYLLGDEGSGYYIGKKLLGDFIRGYMPAPVAGELASTYSVTRESIMTRLYSGPSPNRYCAGFVPFLENSQADVDYTRGLVASAFADFFKCLVCKYADYKRYSFNCTGSVAYAFRDILADTAARYQMPWGTVLKAPIQGLVGYHGGLYIKLF
ncbi:N-acetylglucosamine kinase [Dinghuibacter silviterrae]|uniref:N-acetylglucosamine kinase-like BadF-type ATPase n=1 Tax=Dinghuibacter silviterrae TaxID=1539049 RepID=A0A4R8DED9_9BACT|nr:N-acetylglucosamine kinase [Dinghuibacter silviterrae]TDW95889.1 hypothetical protein EDB95_3710 [Dinghuibacter silviterrae]